MKLIWDVLTYFEISDIDKISDKGLFSKEILLILSILINEEVKMSKIDKYKYFY